MSWLDWLITPTCPLCQRPTTSGEGCFCQDCAAQLQPVKKGDWQLARLTPPADCSVVGWGLYQGRLRQSLRSLKYNRQPEIGETLGRWMGQRWVKQQPLQVNGNSRLIPPQLKAKKGSGQDRSRYHRCQHNNWWVVPIPLHSDRLRERGFNQAETIARAFCEVTGTRLHSRLLQRVQATVPQFGLSPLKRVENVNRAFAVESCDRPHPPILLVDDIYTTGSTLMAAYHVLVSQGWHVGGALAAAFATMEQS